MRHRLFRSLGFQDSFLLLSMAEPLQKKKKKIVSSTWGDFHLARILD